MPLRASSHLGSPNSPSYPALAWYSCWLGLSPWDESVKWTRVARTAVLTRYRYATQPTNPTPGSWMSRNYTMMIIQFVLPLMTFYRSGALRSNVYKRDIYVTSWRFHNCAWQPQHHGHLSSAVQRRSPGRQMRPVNGTGNPYLHSEWSVLWLMNFLHVFHSLTTVCSLEKYSNRFESWQAVWQHW